MDGALREAIDDPRNAETVCFRLCKRFLTTKSDAWSLHNELRRKLPAASLPLLVSRSSGPWGQTFAARQSRSTRRGCPHKGSKTTSPHRNRCASARARMGSAAHPCQLPPCSEEEGESCTCIPGGDSDERKKRAKPLNPFGSGLNNQSGQTCAHTSLPALKPLVVQ